MTHELASILARAASARAVLATSLHGPLRSSTVALYVGGDKYLVRGQELIVGPRWMWGAPFALSVRVRAGHYASMLMRGVSCAICSLPIGVPYPSAIERHPLTKI